VTGNTRSLDFPLRDPLQATCGCGPSVGDAFITKIDSAGTSLIYSTYLGGLLDDRGFGIEVDLTGRATIAGMSRSTGFPVVNPSQGSLGGLADTIVAQLSADGQSLEFSTFLGGSVSEQAFAMDAAPDGSTVTIAGETESSDFPTVGATRPFGGGRDAFAAKLNMVTGEVVFSRYLGGQLTDDARGVTENEAGETFVVGRTESPDYPSVSAFQPRLNGSAYDGFLTRLDPAGQILYSSYLGGSSSEILKRVVVNGCDDVIVSGESASANYPVVGSLYPFSGTGFDTVVTVFDPSLAAIRFSTYLGGTNQDWLYGMRYLPEGDALWLVGNTLSSDYPTMFPFQAMPVGSYEASIARIEGLGSSGVVPGSLGNTLTVIHDLTVGTVTFGWGSSPDATGYTLYEDVIKSGPLLGITGTVPGGVTQLTIANPPQPLLFYRIAGESCAGEGPK
jgi:hypothetical protein